jgi:hypothetical protein
VAALVRLVRGVKVVTRSRGDAQAGTRRIAYAVGACDGDDEEGWAMLLEPWDCPPSWFDGIPAVDLQPRIAAAMEQAIARSWASDRGATATERLEAMFSAAGAAIVRLRAEGPLYAGSGAFAAGVIRSRGQTAAGWIGQSLVYVLAGGGLRAASTDHTFGGEAARDARVAEVLRASPSLATVITRCLPDGAPEITTLSLDPGSTAILGSSSLGHAWFEGSAGLLTAAMTVDAVADALIAASPIERPAALIVVGLA